MPRVALTTARRFAASLLSLGRRVRPELAHLPCIPVPAGAFETLTGPEAFRQRLLDLIGQARIRICLSALYLQDDDAGREVLDALYAARSARPELQVAVFVDWHRAQRGLIGKTRSAGNAGLYRELAARLGPGVSIHGVPVQTREILGVMHLKGFIVDDQVLYSGASLNDVYLQRHGRYRLDRYHLVRSQALADSLAGLLTEVLLQDPAVRTFEGRPGRTPRVAIAGLRRRLKKADYAFTPGRPGAPEIGITPLLGLGRPGNALNEAILQLVQGTRDHLVVFTPYFNLPRTLKRAVGERLKAGCRITLVLGDKTANDFYIPPSEPFRLIGVIPYLYETNLRRFCKAHQKAIDRGLLNVHLWKDGDNTFHLKGLCADGKWSILTGNNLNPRAWRLDLENGLLVRDPHRLLAHQQEQELHRILAHARRLDHHSELETAEDYPPQVKRVLKRLTRPRIDRLVGQVL